MKLVTAAALGVLLGATPYSWKSADSDEPLSERIAPPDGYTRVEVEDGSFGQWLRGLPLKPGRPDVYLYNGKKKRNQRAQHAVVDIDVGTQDLQQCADAVMRLRAEYLFAAKKTDEICFRFTSGDKHPWSKWAAGTRPRVKGNEVSWSAGAAEADSSYSSFRSYMNSVFMWAGTYSLSKELTAVEDATKIEVGDVFIQGGFPGHAVLVADVAVNEKGERVFLLLQSYMPAQNIHVLKNPNDRKLSPWYSATETGTLVTPEWEFERSNLKRFASEGCP